MSSGFETVEHQLRDFFSEARALDRAHLRRLRQAGRRAPGRVSLQTTPQFLAAVASPAWMPELTRLSRQIWLEAAVVGRRLPVGFGRRAVTRAIAGAALVILTDSSPGTAIESPLRDRLTYAWRYAGLGTPWPAEEGAGNRAGRLVPAPRRDAPLHT